MFSDILDNAGKNFYFYDLKNQLTRYIYARSQKAFEAGCSSRDAILSHDGLMARQKDIAEAFTKSVGGLPPMDTPLNPQILGTLQCEGFRIEKIIFESRPKAYVTSNMYIPDDCSKPTGAVLILCGHSRESKQSRDHQLVCRHLVSAGLIVLITDPIGQGERLSYCNDLGTESIPWGTSEHDYAGAQCLPLGNSIAKYFAHDAMRAIDYLISRPEVNPSKIGVGGASGGGTQTAMLMMCDRRIAAAAPCIFITNRKEYMYSGQAQDAEQIWPGMTGAGFDHEDILLAMAPKPVLVSAAAYDFFPIEGTMATFSRAKRFWEMYDMQNNLELFVENCTHSYTTAMAVRKTEFFSFHLLGKRITPHSESIKPIENPQKLLCTQSGQVKTQFPNARFIYEENLTELSELDFSDKQDTQNWLRGKITEGRDRNDLNIRHVCRTNAYEFSVLHSIWRSQKGLFSHAHFFRSDEDGGEKLPVTIALWEGGTTQTSRHIDWLRRECGNGRAVMVLDVAGVGALSPHPVNSYGYYDFYGTVHKLALDLIWLGDSLPAVRAYDVVRAVDALNEDWPNVNTTDIKLYLSGRHSLYGHLAAAVDSRIGGIEENEAFTGFEKMITSRYYDEKGIYDILLPDIVKHERALYKIINERGA